MKSQRDKYFLHILTLKIQLQAAKDLIYHLWGHVHEASVPLSTRQKVEAILKGHHEIRNTNDAGQPGTQATNNAEEKSGHAPVADA